MPIIEFQGVYNKDPFIVSHSLPGTVPATAANYGVIFNAQFSCEVVAFAVSHEVISLSGTVTLEKLTGTTAPGSGINLLSSTISTGGITNTVNHGIFIVSGTARQLARGDRLAIRDGGDLTGLVGLSTTTIIKPLGKGHYAFVLGSAGRT